MTDERDPLADETPGAPPEDFRRAAHRWFYPQGRPETAAEAAHVEPEGTPAPAEPLLRPDQGPKRRGRARRARPEAPPPEAARVRPSALIETGADEAGGEAPRVVPGEVLHP